MSPLRALPALVLSAGILCLAPGAASAATCVSGTTSWNGNGGDHKWENDLNWSNGGPNGGCNVAIDGASVTTNGGNAGSLSLTGGASLTVLGYTAANGTAQDGNLSVGPAATISSGSSLVLSASSADLSGGAHALNPGGASISGTISNSGSISTVVGQTGPGGVTTGRAIAANVTNNNGGVIALHTDMNTCGCGVGGTWVNNGTLTVDAGTTSTFTRTGAGVSFAQAGGTFANNGSTLISGTVTHSGGTTTGNPIHLTGDLDPSGPGAAKFLFDAVPNVSGGGNLTADIGSGTTITVHSTTATSTTLGVETDLTNHGTLTLDGGPGQDQLLGSGTHVLSNAGTLNLANDSAGGAPSTHITTRITNTGTVALAAGSAADSNAPFVQQGGTMTIGAGATFSTNALVTLSGGALANSGSFTGGDFSHTGGTETGNRVVLCGGTLTAPGTQAASFDFYDDAGCSGGSIADGTTVGVGNDIRFRTSRAQTDVYCNTITNDGTISVDSTTGHQVQLHGGTLTNAGTLNLTGSNLAFNLVNSGTTHVIASMGLSTGLTGSITQSGGALTVDGGAVLGFGKLTLDAGTIANSGTMASTGDLTATGGDATGNPVTFSSANITLSGSGTGTFAFADAGLLSSVIPAGYHLIADGGFAVQGSGTTVNSGTLELRGGISNPNVHGGSIDNQGTLSATPSAASSRGISSAFQNHGVMSIGASLGVGGAFSTSGSVDVTDGATLSTPGFTQTAGTTTLHAQGDTLLSTAAVAISGGTLAGAGNVTGDVVSHGTVAPAAAPASLAISGTYTQAADGFLSTRVAAAGTGTLKVGGAATIDGTLQVSTDSAYAPPKDQVYDVLDATVVNGTFSAVAGLGSGPYTLAYAPAAVRLTAQGRPVAPAPSLAIGDATVANPHAGQTTATFTVTLSESVMGTVTVPYSTANGTASTPDEYQSTKGTLTFSPGQTTATIPVTVYGTDRSGASRTFFLDLGNPTGATLSNARGVGTILGHLALASIAPASGGDAGPTTVTITGSGLSSDDKVSLTAAGKPAIDATAVDAAADGRTLHATFDLTKAALGARTVAVSSGTGLGVQTLPGAFTVSHATEPFVTAEIDGPRTTRLDGNWFGHVYLHNRGNTDAVNTLVRVEGLPTGVFAGVIGAEGEPVRGDDGEEGTVTFMVARVPGSSDVPIALSFNFNDLNVAHKVVAGLRAKVLLVSNPELDATDNSTVLSEGKGADGHFRGVVEDRTAGGTQQTSYELYAAPPPAGETLPYVKFTPGTTTDTLTIAVALPRQGCEIPGNVQADVLNWACSAQSATNSCNYFTGVGCSCNPVTGLFCGSRGRAVQPGAATRRRSISAETLEVLWERVHQTHTALEGKAAVASAYSGEEKERGLVIGCLHSAGFIDTTDKDLLDIAAERDQGFEWTKFGVGLKGAGPVAGLTTVAAFQVIGAAFEDKFDKELVRRLLEAARYRQAGNEKKNPFFDIATEIGTRDLTEEDVRRVRNLAELECEKALIHEEGEAPGGHWRLPVSALLSNDPNDMVGPAGPGKSHYVNGVRTPYRYTATFENLPTATAPAYAVSVTDKLDTARLDPATATLGPVSFGLQTVTPPPGLSHYRTEVDLRPASDQLVDVTGDIDQKTGIISWRFVTVDPLTHQVVLTPTGGFLPPDKNTPEGEGSVSFTAFPTAAGRRAKARTGNAATIVFDSNPPINTPTWINVVDRSRPAIRRLTLSSKVLKVRHRRVHTLRARYSGRDSGSGVGTYDVFLAQGRGAFKAVRTRTASSSVTLPCRPGLRYRVAVAARDRVGNAQKGRRASRPVRCR